MIRSLYARAIQADKSALTTTNSESGAQRTTLPHNGVGPTLSYQFIGVAVTLDNTNPCIYSGHTNPYALSTKRLQLTAFDCFSDSLSQGQV